MKFYIFATFFICLIFLPVKSWILFCWHLHFTPVTDILIGGDLKEKIIEIDAEHSVCKKKIGRIMAMLNQWPSISYLIQYVDLEVLDFLIDKANEDTELIEVNKTNYQNKMMVRNFNVYYLLKLLEQVFKIQKNDLND